VQNIEDWCPKVIQEDKKQAKFPALAASAVKNCMQKQGQPTAASTHAGTRSELTSQCTCRQAGRQCTCRQAAPRCRMNSTIAYVHCCLKPKYRSSSSTMLYHYLSDYGMFCMPELSALVGVLSVPAPAATTGALTASSLDLFPKISTIEKQLCYLIYTTADK
jgi:hypothetical protein